MRVTELKLLMATGEGAVTHGGEVPDEALADWVRAAPLVCVAAFDSLDSFLQKFCSVLQYKRLLLLASYFLLVTDERASYPPKHFPRVLGS